MPTDEIEVEGLIKHLKQIQEERENATISFWRRSSQEIEGEHVLYDECMLGSLPTEIVEEHKVNEDES